MSEQPLELGLDETRVPEQYKVFSLLADKPGRFGLDAEAFESELNLLASRGWEVISSSTVRRWGSGTVLVLILRKVGRLSAGG